MVQITNSTPFIEHGKMFIQSENCIFWDFKNHRKRSQYCHWQNWNVTHYFLVTLWSNRICYNRNVTAWCTSAAHIPPNQKTPLHCHTSNLRVNKKDGRMELSKYAWKLREKGKEVAVWWEIIKMSAIQDWKKGVWCLQHKEVADPETHGAWMCQPEKWVEQ